MNGEPSLAGRDAVFARLAQESITGHGASSAGFLAGVALAPKSYGPAPAADGTGTEVVASGGPKSPEPSTPLAAGSRQVVRPERGAADLTAAFVGRRRQPGESGRDSVNPASA
jgi:hypothetical protein